MTAKEIRNVGVQVKSWSRPDGTWYVDQYQIWQVGDKFYQIHDHVGTSFGCTSSKFGMVTEVPQPEPLPTHMGIILGVRKGDAWVEDTFQGVPDAVAEWFNRKVQELMKIPYKRNNKYFLKITELDFE